MFDVKSAAGQTKLFNLVALAKSFMWKTSIYHYNVGWRSPFPVQVTLPEYKTRDK